ncbi:hypothetical protein [Falsiroseomonas sp. HW251]|uniref:hypothetical protein n=1 Tax=Falsiroseomonas sp. HW251 TaxID=3390998 RepID=UPI003D315615
MRAAASLLGAAVALALAGAASAFEYTQFRAVVLPTDDPAAVHGIPAIIEIPAGWQPGHAAAVVLFDPPEEPALKDALLVALLDSGAAVLMVDANAARGFSEESGNDPPPPTAESLVRDLAAALASLRRDAGAGVVVAIGHGLGGEAALLATDPARLGPFGQDGPGFAAVASVGPGTPVFRAGAGPDPSEGWNRRAPLLCDVLAFALGALPTPRPAVQVAQAGPETGGACREALAAR